MNISNFSNLLIGDQTQELENWGIDNLEKVGVTKLTLQSCLIVSYGIVVYRFLLCVSNIELQHFIVGTIS